MAGQTETEKKIIKLEKTVSKLINSHNQSNRNLSIAIRESKRLRDKVNLLEAKLAKVGS